jgi:hypothetical protein
MDSDGASNRRAALVSKPSDLEYNVMQLLLRRILTLIEAGVPATAAATATALATAKSVIDTTWTAVNTTIPGTITTMQGNVTTLLANAVLILARFTGVMKVYPTLAAGVAVTCDAAGNTLGAFAQIVAANAITTAFIVRGVNVQISDLGAGEYAEVVLYYGDTDIEFGRFFCQANNSGFFPLTGPIIPANSKIRAKASCSAAAARAITCSLSYHA